MGSHNFQPLDESISFFEKVSYSGYCHVHSDGRSMTALGGKIPDISIDHVLSGKKPADDPVL